MNVYIEYDLDEGDVHTRSELGEDPKVRMCHLTGGFPEVWLFKYIYIYIYIYISILEYQSSSPDLRC